MGRIITPKYRVEAQDNQGAWQHSVWRGRVSVKALEQWRDGMNQSFQRGGVNEHVSNGLGFVLHYSNCRIVDQRNSNIVAAFRAPMFEIA
jgi:hypothetical protein